MKLVSEKICKIEQFKNVSIILRFDASVFDPAATRNRKSFGRESIQYRRRQTKQVVDLLCQEKVHGEIAGSLLESFSFYYSVIIRRK